MARDARSHRLRRPSSRAPRSRSRTRRQNDLGAQQRSSALARAFLPLPGSVTPDYAAHRAVALACALLSTLRTLLTAAVILSAMGVGNSGKSPAAYLLVSEFATVLGRAVGLALSAMLPSAYFAARAKLFAALTALLAPLPDAMPLLLLDSQDWLPIVLVSKSVLSAALSVMAAPAEAALWAHVVMSPNPAERSKVALANANQEALCSYAGLLCRFVGVYVLCDYGGSDASQIVPAWLLIAVLEAGLGLSGVAAAAVPTFNGERFSRAVANAGAGVTVASPAEVAKTERWLVSDAVEMGASARSCLVFSAGLHGAARPSLSCDRVHGAYVVVHGAGRGGALAVLLRQDAVAEDMVRASWHARRMSNERVRLESKAPSRAEWERFKTAAVAAGWRCDQALFALSSEWRYATPPVLREEGGRRVVSVVQVRVGADGTVVESDMVVGEVGNSAANDTCVSVERLPGAVSGRPGAGAATRRAAPAEILRGALRRSLLPVGFPHSTAPEYMHYQLYDTLQVAVGELRGILIAQAALIAVGVGVAGVTPRDGLLVGIAVESVGATASIVAGFVCDPTRSAAALKTWRVVSTALSSCGSALALCSGMMPARRLLFGSVNAVLQNGFAPFGQGATEALVMHLSNGSLDPAFRADVAAKEKAQDRALGLVLLVARYALLLLAGTNLTVSWVVVLFLSVLHMLFNFLAAGTLKLEKAKSV